ncbi:MAG: response regulator transcription factor [Reichenbachiella sp.]|uniref:response regulator n=1 Tax=Reichenbachiella sp. TaxID=2184521 RepID=UPI002965F03C|nr:response regulator transcription factor [Reichenbachiella sp.]MDW3208459.1 response regulator transcription factor [Reichenbachiella sp.]
MKKVLIVDDSFLIRQTLKKLLPACGNIEIVGECNDGNQVMDFLYNYWVDTIILDYHMPKMNGAETAKRVKESFNHINIILHTSDREMAYITDHVDDVIIKPAKFFELAQLVKKDMLVSSR